jgi:S1-C subfamily serine protease
VVGLFGLALVTLTGLGLSASGAVDTGTQSAVKIETADGIGSGVDVGNGIIITANHVVGDHLTVAVHRENGDVAIAGVLWTDTVHDVAAVALPNGSGSHASVACNYTPTVGDPIEIVGNPMGVFEFVHTWGKIARSGYMLNNDHLPNWPTIMLADATATFGNSGGPVYSADTHEVIGILVGGVVTPAGEVPLSFIVPSAVICKDMSEHAPVS